MIHLADTIELPKITLKSRLRDGLESDIVSFDSIECPLDEATAWFSMEPDGQGGLAPHFDHIEMGCLCITQEALVLMDTVRRDAIGVHHAMQRVTDQILEWEQSLREHLEGQEDAA